MTQPPKLDYATENRRPIRRATWRDHITWAVMGLLWSIAVGIVLMVAGWLFSRS